MTSNENLKILIETFQEGINKKVDYLTESFKKYNEEVSGIKERQQVLKLENQELKKDFNLMKKELDYLANKDKVNNIVLYNVIGDEEINTSYLLKISRSSLKK